MIFGLIALLAAFWYVQAAHSTVVLSPKACLYEHELAHAGGWGAGHPDAIYTKRCGHLPMPPHAFPLAPGVKPSIHYIPYSQMWWHCGPRTQACSQIGGNNPTIYLPIQ